MIRYDKCPSPGVYFSVTPEGSAGKRLHCLEKWKQCNKLRCEPLLFGNGCKRSHFSSMPPAT